MNYKSLTNKEKLASLFFVLLSMGQLQRINIGSINFYLHDIFIILWLTYFLLKKNQKIFSRLFFKLCKLSYLNRLALFYFAIIFIYHSLFGNQQNLLSLLYLIRWAVYILFAISLKVKIKKPILNFYLLASGLLFSFWGLLQYIFLPDTRFLKILGWDDHYYRLLSTQLDPNFAGILIVLAFWQLQKYKNKISSWLYILVNLLLILSLTLTYSRASFLAFVISLFFHAIFSLRKKRLEAYPIIWILAFVSIFLSNLFFNQLILKPGGEGVKLSRTSTVNVRVTILKNLVSNTSGVEWLVGKGLILKNVTNNYNLWPNHSKFPPNIFVLIFQFSGLMGLSLIVYNLGKWFLANTKKKLLVGSVFLAVLIHSQFNHTLFQAFIFLWINLF